MSYFLAARVSMMTGYHASSEFDGKAARIELHGLERGKRLIADHRWDPDFVFKRFGSDNICQETSWISYWPDADEIAVCVLLTEARLRSLQPNLDKMLHGSQVELRLCLAQASFSQVENNALTRHPTLERFIAGEPLFTEDEIDFSFQVGEAQ